jgi:hypothetical protein
MNQNAEAVIYQSLPFRYSRHSKANKKLFTYIATWRRVFLTIVLAEKYYIISACFSSLGYPAFKAPAPYHGVLSSVECWALEIFSTLPHKRNDILKKFLNLKCVFLFSLQLLFTAFPIPRINEPDNVINVHRSCKMPLNKI